MVQNYLERVRGVLVRPRCRISTDSIARTSTT